MAASRRSANRRQGQQQAVRSHDESLRHWIAVRFGGHRIRPDGSPDVVDTPTGGRGLETAPSSCASPSSVPRRSGRARSLRWSASARATRTSRSDPPRWAVWCCAARRSAAASSAHDCCAKRDCGAPFRAPPCAPPVLATCEDPSILGVPSTHGGSAWHVVTRTSRLPSTIRTSAGDCAELVDRLSRSCGGLAAAAEGYGKRRLPGRQLRRFGGLWEHNRRVSCPW